MSIETCKTKLSPHFVVVMCCCVGNFSVSDKVVRWRPNYYWRQSQGC